MDIESSAMYDWGGRGSANYGYTSSATYIYIGERGVSVN